MCINSYRKRNAVYFGVGLPILHVGNGVRNCPQGPFRCAVSLGLCISSILHTFTTIWQYSNNNQQNLDIFGLCSLLHGLEISYCTFPEQQYWKIFVLLCRLLLHSKFFTNLWQWWQPSNHLTQSHFCSKSGQSLILLLLLRGHMVAMFVYDLEISAPICILIYFHKKSSLGTGWLSFFHRQHTTSTTRHYNKCAAGKYLE